MSLVDLVMPKLGESIMEATILKWYKSVGDTIQLDETLLDIATDKVDSEVPSTAAGVIKEILFDTNSVVSIGTVIARIQTAGSDTAIPQKQMPVTPEKEVIAPIKEAPIEIVTTEKSNTETLLKGWYKEKAKQKFAEIAEPLIERFKKYNVIPKGIYIQEMSRRWGSCTPKGKIILNTELIKAPKACIEYVIIHELCHLVHHDHTQKFIDLQTREMPDWEKWKNKLEKLLA